MLKVGSETNKKQIIVTTQLIGIISEVDVVEMYGIEAKYVNEVK